jgi:hypothetical protein
MNMSIIFIFKSFVLKFYFYIQKYTFTLHELRENHI